MRNTTTAAGPRFRVGIYARFSSDLQEARSIDDQIGYCTQHVEKNGWRIVGTYADRALSGATVHGRTEFLRLIADAEAGRFDAVLTEDLDRLSRNAAETLEYHARLAFAGVKVITVADGELDDLMAGFKGIMAQQFRKNLGGHVRRGMAGRVREGKSMGGRAYGYRLVAGQPGALEIVDAEAEIVRRIFAETLAGASPRTIALALNRDGIPAPRAALWNGHAINGSKGSGVLRNPIYKGVLAWNRRQTARNPTTGKIVMRAKAAADHMAVAKPELAIVTEIEWNGAQAVLSKRGGDAERHRPAQPRHLLSGLMRCGKCGAAMVSCGGKDPSNPRITCWNRKVKGATACDNATILKRDLEARIVPALQELLAAKGLDAAMQTFVAEQHAAQASAGQARRGSERRLGEIKRELGRLVDAIASGRAPKAILDKMNALEAEQQTLAERLADQPQPNVITLHAKTVSHYRRLAADLVGLLAERGDDDAELFAAIRKVIEEVVIHPAGAGRERPIELRGTLQELLADKAARGFTVGSTGARSSHHNPRVTVAA